MTIVIFVIPDVADMRVAAALGFDQPSFGFEEKPIPSIDSPNLRFASRSWSKESE